MINSQKKGKGFERECAHLLNKTTGGARWNRTSGSGAMHTAQGIQDNRFRGDLFSEDPRFKDVIVECKIQRKPINLYDLVNPKSIWNEWITQTQKESGGQTWILLFRWNAGNLMIASATSDIRLLEKMFDVPLVTVLRRGELIVATFG